MSGYELPAISKWQTVGRYNKKDMGIEGIEKLANILGADAVKKVYEDGLSESVHEIAIVASLHI